MVKRLLVSAVALSLLFVAVSAFSAPAPAFKNGGIEIQAGVGIGFWGYYSGASMTVPPIIVSAEYQAQFGRWVPLSFGLLAGYTGAEYKYDDGVGDTYTDTFSFIVIGARVAYHFTEFIRVPGLDTYAGVLLGYNIASVSSSGTGIYSGNIPGVSVGGFTYGGYIGARYYFIPNLGVYAELGYTLGYINAGLAVKF